MISEPDPHSAYLPTVWLIKEYDSPSTWGLTSLVVHLTQSADCLGPKVLTRRFLQHCFSAYSRTSWRQAVLTAFHAAGFYKGSVRQPRVCVQHPGMCSLALLQSLHLGCLGSLAEQMRCCWSCDVSSLKFTLETRTWSSWERWLPACWALQLSVGLAAAIKKNRAVILQ